MLKVQPARCSMICLQIFGIFVANDAYERLILRGTQRVHNCNPKNYPAGQKLFCENQYLQKIENTLILCTFCRKNTKFAVVVFCKFSNFQSFTPIQFQVFKISKLSNFQALKRSHLYIFNLSNFEAVAPSGAEPLFKLWKFESLKVLKVRKFEIV